MVEPFAAVVFNKLLSGSASLKSPSSLNSIVRVVSSSSSRGSVGPNFFSPQPRRVKGKDKLQSVADDPCHLLQCQEWSSCSSRHAIWCPHQSRFMMLHELSQAPPRRSQTRPPPPPPHSRCPTRALLPTAIYAGQRRHSSRNSEVAEEANGHLTRADRASSMWTKHEDRIQRVERILQTPRTKLSLDHAWRTYRAAEEYDLPVPTMLAFADKYISAAEMHYRTDTPDQQIQQWGTHGQEILHKVTESVAHYSRFDQWRLCLTARSFALLGDINNAVVKVHEADKVPLLYTLKAGIPYAYEMILASIVRYRSNQEAVEFMASEWDIIGTYLDFKASAAHYAGPQRAGTSLRSLAGKIAAETPDPVSFVTRTDWDKDRREIIGGFFIQALCYAQLARVAYDVFLKMQECHLHVAQHFHFMLVRTFARQTSTIHLATELFRRLPEEHRNMQYLQLGLHVYSRQGNAEAAENYFNSICDQGAPAPDDVAALMHGYAVANQVEKAGAIFDEFFPHNTEGKRTNSPVLKHYSAIIYAHARVGDQEGINRWLQDMTSADLVPNVYIFTIVLNAFAAAGDIDTVMAVLAQMKQAAIQPDAVTYTIIISLLAHRKDPLGAEILFKRAVKEGIRPTNRMIVSMMNAHVEGGSWHGVIRAYDYLTASGIHTMSLEVYNTLIKAYVLIGAPFNVVYKMFKQLEQSRNKPDSYTYSLLVQSACDAGLMDTASDIYYDMEQLNLEDAERNLDVNIYILTIIMAGFLQHGDKRRARAVYDEMRDKGIQPTPITLGTVIKAYGNEKSVESLKIAEDFIKSLLAVPEEERVWKKPKYDAKSALQHLYQPVLSAYAKMQLPEEVERVYQEMVEAGAPLSLGTLTAFLDVHRRTGDVQAILELWPQIFQMGKDLTDRDWILPGDDLKDEVRGLRKNAICVPLSIYIDAMSAGGYHEEIAATWKEMRMEGFTFDSHNWNHLAVAMVRGGEPERAFEVVEKVILPFKDLSARTKEPRDRNASTPLLSDVEPPTGEDDVISEAPGEPPGHTHAKRVTASKIATKRAPALEGWDDPEQDHDLVHHLSILHQISPSWAAWKPHNATIKILLMAYNRLNAGRVIKPIKSEAEVSTHPEDDERPEARAVLNRIYSNYPRTISIILAFDMLERQRLGDEYDEVYTWG